MRRSLLFLAALPVLAGATPSTGGPERTVVPPALHAFGAAVAVQGDELFVGRPGEFFAYPVPAQRDGAVIVFDRSSGEFVRTGAIRGEGARIGDRFGAALDVDGDLLVVGAAGRDDDRGGAYVFERTADSWRQTALLTSRDGLEGDELGHAVAVSGGTIVLGAPGRGDNGAFVTFGRSGDGWSEAGMIEGPDEPTAGRFGSALDLEAGILAVGAPGTFISLIPGVPTATKPGMVGIYRMDGGGWIPEGRAMAETTPPAALLGWSVSVADGRVYAGAPMGDGARGFVQILAPGEDGWSAVGRMVPAQPAPGSGFGISLDVRGDEAVVGAGLGQLAFTFGRTGDGSWTQSGRFTDGNPMTFFGAAVGMGEGYAVVGIPGGDFFEGTGDVLTRGVDGWTNSGTILDDGAGMPAVTGGEVPCSDEGVASGFECEQVDLVSYLPIHAMGGERGDFMNDVWGWTDPETGIEYAIAGMNDGTVFISLEDPANPRYLGKLPLTEGATPNLWRDMKTYADHVFIVADGAGAHGMQVFDLRQLREVTEPVTFEESARYDNIFSAHNIVINEDSGFAYIVGASQGGESCGGALHMVDLRDPTNPTFAGCFQDMNAGLAGTGYTHDAQCIMYAGPDEDYQEREICLNSSETALSIADVTDKDNPITIATASYPNAAYVHQGWASEDHRYFYLNDETDEVSGVAPRTRTLVWDIADLDDPVLVTEHLGTTSASDHNLYIRDNLMYQSNYVSGMRVLDISDPENPTEVAYFDSVPWGDDKPGFAGSFSNYPFFESGVVIMTSMREGLLMLRVRPQPIF